MTHVEKLNEISKQLPEKFLLELIDFAEFLKWKLYNNTQSTIQLTEEHFWQLIDLLDWNKEKNEDITKPLIDELAKYSIEEIYQFEDILTEKLYQLDTIEYAKNMGEESYKEGEYFSGDYFLYTRCCVVANGKDFYNDVVLNPKNMPKGTSFEPLLYVAEKAYQIKTGKKEWDYIPKKLYETGFNRLGWGGTKEISILEYMNGKKWL